MITGRDEFITGAGGEMCEGRLSVGWNRMSDKSNYEFTTDNVMMARRRENVGGHAESQINDGALDSFNKSAKKINGKRKKEKVPH